LYNAWHIVLLETYVWSTKAAVQRNRFVV